MLMRILGRIVDYALTGETRRARERRQDRATIDALGADNRRLARELKACRDTIREREDREKEWAAALEDERTGG